MKKLKKERGITLIALVVTIVVLLILSSVSINVLFGQNGLISKAKDAKTAYKKAEEDDKKAIDNFAEQIDDSLGIYKPGKVAKENVTYQTAIIPKGFAVSGIEGEQDVATGLVIYDTNGKTLTTEEWNAKGEGGEYVVRTTYNQFVWIPVDKSAQYKINEDYGSDYTLADETSDPEATQGVLNKTEEETVKNAGGFYVGRYEAGKEATNKIVCKKGADVWVMIGYNSTKTTQNMIEESKKIKSGMSAMCSDIQWDIIMNTVNNKPDGNGETYDVKTVKAGRHVARAMAVSGNNLHDKVYNIYDLEGNAYEYVAAKSGDDSNGTPFVLRGGSNNYSDPASDRISLHGRAYSNDSFRPVLYVK